MDKVIGKVVHWYDRASVAVVKLAHPLKVGDRIKVSKGDHEFEEAVGSMQVNHEDIASGKAGEEVAIKLSQGTKDGAVVSLAE
ncbi:hypothetical protein A3I40_00325 [Candidatus Uhrbacteria bacterium RIFCSPLOWO2_02_FULL_48_12]|uniref:Translation elongation factor-like protein n=1 Tax=Candidatus Uhrbacteria bacterium RIFCSPLOWO2_02_FULL_48_12 TaxID=1802407 RepID=A0A1F7V7Z0_9BACT|nr:MAG: hypothetical protein A3I40_00325 [Candidatus Uhrbacteria bacterium RIFCSPLOWO2_02_FULL_48_12]